MNNLQVFYVLSLTLGPRAALPRDPVDKRIQKIENRDEEKQFLEVERFLLVNDVCPKYMEHNYQTPEDHEKVVEVNLVLNEVAVVDEQVFVFNHCSFLQGV